MSTVFTDCFTTGTRRKCPKDDVESERPYYAAMVSVTDAVLIIASLAIVFVIARLNSAIKLLNNRVNILSHVQKTMKRSLESAQGSTGIEDEYDKKEAELRARLDRDFR
ncbi:MAG: hypothetical protein ACI9WU_004234 [Myxococcota bacterium]